MGSCASEPIPTAVQPSDAKALLEKYEAVPLDEHNSRLLDNVRPAKVGPTFMALCFWRLTLVFLRCV
jgi:hypothetical protein